MRVCPRAPYDDKRIYRHTYHDEREGSYAHHGCLAPTQSQRSMADDVIEVRAAYSQLQTTIKVLWLAFTTLLAQMKVFYTPSHKIFNNKNRST